MELSYIEKLLDWYLSIPNEYNRKRLASDYEIVKLINLKLLVMEEEY